MAEIEWKGIIWKAAYGELSIRELLTILKGHGPMEILKFRKPGAFWGEMSVSLASDGTKEITLYHLEVEGARRRGQGREALRCLKSIFKGDVFVEDPGKIIRVANADDVSLPFWVKMYAEGVIDALESERLQIPRDYPREKALQLLRDLERESPDADPAGTSHESSK
ncbi:hypothetical protein SAMN02746041_00197 [Desulfacinum hydrothermale DSM 13146]|uniref:Uncharacterized protein n=1 Tax=Desulfacinum hydrothermale DSM 13146 TaxID=1121390 RepID=A0A1W1WZ97_9BACT|nr:hypothetical protein [Desulfacinum hydrothermale]SMC16933.1 hypothetical protein SAMN02746041_00197 [Desulfacinum hydrothermale DSM 13146]